MNCFSVRFAILLTLHHTYCCTWLTVTKALATPTNSNVHMSPVGSKVMRCACEAYIHCKYVHLVMFLFPDCSLVPRPRPAFRRLQYGKAWRAWYLFSREHDVIGKWRKFSEQTGCILSIVQPTTHSTLGVYDNRPPLARYVR